MIVIDAQNIRYASPCLLSVVQAKREPLEVRIIAGWLDMTNLRLLAKLSVKDLHSERAVWRDWRNRQAVHDWAGKIYERIEGSAVEAIALAV